MKKTTESILKNIRNGSFVVQIVFIIFKLLKIISWSWVVVLWPLWINIAFVAVCLMLIGLHAVLKFKEYQE